MLVGLLEAPEYALELHRRDRGRYRLYPYTEKLWPKYIGEFDDEYTYRHRRFLLVPIKCNLSFSYLF